VFRGAVTLETLLKPLIGARRIFGIIGTVILVFFAQGFFHSLKHVIFDIFDIEDRRHPILEMVYNFFTFGLVGGVFLFFSLAISLVSLVSFDQFSLPFTDMVFRLSWIYDFLNLVIPVLFTLILFYIIFRFISEKRMQPKVSLLSGVHNFSYHRRVGLLFCSAVCYNHYHCPFVSRNVPRRQADSRKSVYNYIVIK
jgi:uncharacterized BrkB/YihY/UPF0761 family membrane protein